MTVTKEFNYKNEQRGLLFCFFFKDSFLIGVLDLCTSVIIETENVTFTEAIMLYRARLI